MVVSYFLIIFKMRNNDDLFKGCLNILTILDKLLDFLLGGSSNKIHSIPNFSAPSTKVDFKNDDGLTFFLFFMTCQQILTQMIEFE